jgi:hypothetical protein
MRLGIVILAVVLTLSACVRYGHTEDIHRPVSYAAGSNLFALTVWASDGCPDPDALITLRATVVNQTQQVQVVVLTNQPVLDIVVGNPDRSTIRWSAGRPLTSDLTRLELGPSESKTIEMQWKMQWIEGNWPFVQARLIPDERFVDHPLEAAVSMGYTCGLI